MASRTRRLPPVRPHSQHSHRETRSNSTQDSFSVQDPAHPTNPMRPNSQLSHREMREAMTWGPDPVQAPAHPTNPTRPNSQLSHGELRKARTWGPDPVPDPVPLTDRSERAAESLSELLIWSKRFQGPEDEFRYMKGLTIDQLGWLCGSIALSAPAARALVGRGVSFSPSPASPMNARAAIERRSCTPRNPEQQAFGSYGRPYGNSQNQRHVEEPVLPEQGSDHDSKREGLTEHQPLTGNVHMLADSQNQGQSKRLSLPEQGHDHNSDRESPISVSALQPLWSWAQPGSHSLMNYCSEPIRAEHEPSEHDSSTRSARRRSINVVSEYQADNYTPKPMNKKHEAIVHDSSARRRSVNQADNHTPKSMKTENEPSEHDSSTRSARRRSINVVSEHQADNHTPKPMNTENEPIAHDSSARSARRRSINLVSEHWLRRRSISSNAVTDTPLLPKAPAKDSHFDQCGALARKFGLPIWDVRDLVKEFHDVDFNSDGTLSPEEFQALIRRRCQIPVGDPIPPHLEHQWHQANTDGDDSITLEEFFTWSLAHAYSEEMVIDPQERILRDIARRFKISIVVVEKLKAEFNKFDTDGSGTLDAAEFKLALAALLKVSEDEVSQNRFRQYWFEADTNHDHLISLEEFIKWYHFVFLGNT